MTARYTHGRRGYKGLEGIWLIRHLGDYAVNRGDLIFGHMTQDADKEWRCLLRFRGLDIPAGSEILSAQLSIACNEVRGAPVIGIHGLLRDFSTPAREWQSALPGDTTWDSQFHQRRVWGAPGAGKGGKRFAYDGEFDHFSTPDDTASPEWTGRFFLDVTPSFSDQFANGKEYGWLLEEMSGELETYVHLAEEGASLTVEYLPEAGAAISQRAPPQARLITFQLAEPQQLRQNMARLDELPFEGAVFFGTDSNGQKWISNGVFSPDRMSYDDYAEFIEASKVVSATPSPLTDNFLRVNTCVPGTLDPKDEPYVWDNRPRPDESVTMWWADGFEAIEHNMKMAVQVAHDAGLKGIFLEGEEYGGNIWSYRQQRDAAERGKSYEETCMQVRRRARQLAEGINAVYPDMTMIIYFYIYRDPPKDAGDSLWNSFMDGLIEGVDPRMRLVVANSGGYLLLSKSEFSDLYDFSYERAPQISAVPEKYLRQVEVGFGVWFNSGGWGHDPELNGSAARWQTQLENALEVADSYVWVFTGGSGGGMPDWWSGARLPQQYIDATRKAIDLTRSRKALR